MEKLLDYMENQSNVALLPPPTEDSERVARIKKQIDIDAKWNFTPDRALLRYSGPQDVFIWDNLKKPENLDWETALNLGVDYEIVNYSVRTIDKFAPFEDWAAKSGDKRYILPSDPSWAEKFGGDEVKLLKLMPASAVQGRIIRCNLKTIESLDLHYGNTKACRRQLRQVRSTTGAFKSHWVWMYCDTYKGLGKFDPHLGKYRLHKGFDPRTIRRTYHSDDYQYEVDAYQSRLTVLH